MKDFETELQQTAKRIAGGIAVFEGSLVTEKGDGAITWEGIVFRFASRNGKVYAWATRRGRDRKYVAMLHRPPVDSPLAAVREWLHFQHRGPA
jgi:hypothetical protein